VGSLQNERAKTNIKLFIMSVSKLGYQIYMSEVRTRVTNDIVKKLRHESEPTTQIVMNEITRRWNSLPDYSREHYKRKATK
tara:strand:+ start:1755 stop:1997 length:243 start_codon:yes stop_codon:yes gene_type:complete